MSFVSVCLLCDGQFYLTGLNRSLGQGDGGLGWPGGWELRVCVQLGI